MESVWSVQDQRLMQNSGPVIDYILSGDSNVSEMEMLVARGIGAESALYKTRQGIAIN